MAQLSSISKEKMHLIPILNIICWAEVSRKYFGKSNSWLYHKLNGVDGNGKPTSFNDEEKQTLKDSLVSLSSQIREIAETL